ncbi:MAG TPA: ribosome recycling factor [Candidatus Paceibacterota bacterium]|nr:ribosome recycling factor [Candidatus Paceibacterota bacterium]
MYNFSLLKKKAQDVESWLLNENTQIRTGRATPAILDGVKIEAYGSQMPISQLASVTGEDARTLRVTPYDASVVKDLEKGIQAADLGLGIANDGKGLRLTFPQLTTERRTQFVKIAKDKLEQAKISLRGLRDDTWQEIQNKEKEGGMSEDDKFRFKTEMEKIIQETQKKLEEMMVKKEKEILEQ